MHDLYCISFVKGGGNPKADLVKWRHFKQLLASMKRKQVGITEHTRRYNKKETFGYTEEILICHVK